MCFYDSNVPLVILSLSDNDESCMVGDYEA